MASKRRPSASASDQMRSRAQQQAQRSQTVKALVAVTKKRSGLAVDEADASERRLRANAVRKTVTTRQLRDLERAAGLRTHETSEAETIQMRGTAQRKATNARALKDLGTAAASLRRKKKR